MLSFDDVPEKVQVYKEKNRYIFDDLEEKVVVQHRAGEMESSDYDYLLALWRKNESITFH